MSNKIEKPRFQLERVCDDGSREEPELHSLDGIDADCRMGRRGFLLTSVIGAGTLAALLFGYNSGSANARDDKPVSDPYPASPAGPKANDDYPPHAPRISASEIHGLAAHRNTVHSLVFSPDSKTMFTVGNDNEVKLWSIPDGKLQKTFGDGPFMSIALGADGKTLITGHFDGMLKLWREPFAKVGKEIGSGLKYITNIALGPDGKTLAVSMLGEGIQLRSFPSGNVLAAMAQGKNIARIAFSPDGAMLAGSVVSTKETLLWSVPSGDLLARWSFPSESMVFNADGTLLVAAGHRGVTQLSHTPSGNTENVLGGKMQYTPLAFSPDGKWLALKQGPGGVLLFPAPFSEPAVVIDGHEKDVFSAAFSKDNRFLAVGTITDAVYVWELTGGKKIPCTLKAVLYDADSMSRDASVRYAVTSEKSIYIGRCGDPLPAGAVCACNCVAGHISSVMPMRNTAPSRGGGGGRRIHMDTCVPIPIK